jgi:DnaK suppressor protein
MMMNIQDFKRRLLELEQQLASRSAGQRSAARDQTLTGPGDTADASVADESESEDFSEAALDTATLQRVREALARMDDGTFGLCIVDGEPIESKRLEAVPWTPYCIKHQRLLEAERRPRMPTL